MLWGFGSYEAFDCVGPLHRIVEGKKKIDVGHYAGFMHNQALLVSIDL
jgi:hypothetical protein